MSSGSKYYGSNGHPSLINPLYSGKQRKRFRDGVPAVAPLMDLFDQYYLVIFFLLSFFVVSLLLLILFGDKLYK